MAEFVSDVVCYFPLNAWQSVDKSITFRETSNSVRNLKLPCGRCTGCRLERSRQWAMRCMHEASLYASNCFITLTYSSEYLDDVASLHYPDFQLFMKRLRERFSGDRIRFYMCGEYGSKKMRPHFHALLFNFTFPDLKLWKKSDSGEFIYRSAILEDLWPFGFSSVGECTFQSAAYIARYCLKKKTGDLAPEHYTRVNDATGEILELVPEFNKMSLKPGIGADWYAKYKQHVIDNDFIVVNGKKCKVPRFYDLRTKAENPYDFDDIASKRELSSYYKNQAPLESQLIIADRRVGLLKRTLE